MPRPIDTQPYLITGATPLRLADHPTHIDPVYEGKKDYKKQLKRFRREIDELQNMMYAHDRYAMLLIFQAMDAAGKDGTIRHVMSGVNPHGVVVHSFKRPSTNELEHDFMWRTTVRLPMRGNIGIFNRSYYEEVLVVRVHPGILTGGQRVPAEFTADLDAVWQQRYEDIRHFERYLHRNGTKVIKFFLNLSKEEQRLRFLSRLDTPAKNWKFSDADVKERGYWDSYQRAYEDAINATATPEAPWVVVPADDKRTMRLIVSQVVNEALCALPISYPEVSETRLAEFETFRQALTE